MLPDLHVVSDLDQVSIFVPFPEDGLAERAAAIDTVPARSPRRPRCALFHLRDLVMPSPLLREAVSVCADHDAA